MIGTEISRQALTVDGGVEHAAQVDARDGSRVHADTHQTTGEVIHDHEHPIRPQHERFAAKQVDAPEAIGGVSDDRQPRRAGPVGGGPIVLGEDATHDGIPRAGLCRVFQCPPGSVGSHGVADAA